MSISTSHWHQTIVIFLVMIMTIMRSTGENVAERLRRHERFSQVSEVKDESERE